VIGSGPGLNVEKSISVHNGTWGKLARTGGWMMISGTVLPDDMLLRFPVSVMFRGWLDVEPMERVLLCRGEVGDSMTMSGISCRGESGEGIVTMEGRRRGGASELALDWACRRFVSMCKA
jgi:hypothetical protein